MGRPKPPWRTTFAALHPRAYLGLHGLAGIVLVALLLWAFAAIADAVSEKSILATMDVTVTAWLQSHGTEAGEAVFSWISWLGAPVLTVAVVALTVRYASQRDWRRAATIAAASGGGAILNIALKALFHRGRPEFASEFVSGTSWSFPSGHAMNSMIGYGTMAYFLLERTKTTSRRVAVIVATCVIIAMIGFSRVYLGVHYLSDVVAGFLAGAVWLLVCLVGYRFRSTRDGRSHPAGG